MTDDPLEDIRVNATNDASLSKSKSISTAATLQLNRKLNDRGRNVTFRGRFGYGDNDNDQYTQSETRYYQILNALEVTPSCIVTNTLRLPPAIIIIAPKLHTASRLHGLLFYSSVISSSISIVRAIRLRLIC